MSALGVYDDDDDSKLLPPPGKRSRSKRRRRRRRGASRDASAHTTARRHTAYMLESGSESAAFDATDMEYATSDYQSSARRAREHSRRVHRSMLPAPAAAASARDTSDNDTSSFEEEELSDESASSGELKEKRPPKSILKHGAPPPDDDGGTKKDATMPRMRGGKVFGVSAGGLPMEETQCRRDGATDAVGRSHPFSVNDELAEMRSTQIRKSVRRMSGGGGGGGGGGNGASTSGKGGGEGQYPSVAELVVEGESDRALLNRCIDMVIENVRNNPFYRFATEAATAAGHHNYPQKFLSSKTQELLKLIDPESGGSKRAFRRQSTNDMKRDAEALRSAAYFLKSQVQAFDPSEVSAQYARDSASRVALQTLDSMRDIHEEHVRMREALRDARPIVHQRIYFSDALLSYLGPAMQDLYDEGLSSKYDAAYLILHSEHVRSLFAQLVAARISALKLQNGTGPPALQAQYMVVSSTILRYSRTLVDAVNNDATHHERDPYADRVFSTRYAYGQSGDTRKRRAWENELPMPGNSSRKLQRLLRR